MKKISIFFLLLMALAACQKTQVAEFRKYVNDADVPRITLADAKKAYDDGSGIIIDARPADAYKLEHIKGSMNIPIGSPDTEFDKLPKGKKIILYCS